MEIVHDERELETYMKEAVRVSKNHPVLIDSYLQNAVELDVDAVCDGKEVLIGGIMEHIERVFIRRFCMRYTYHPYLLRSWIPYGNLCQRLPVRWAVRGFRL